MATNKRWMQPTRPPDAVLTRNPNLTGPLADWLARLEQRAPAAEIKLGLERVQQVRQRLELRMEMPVISVAGTNGKGSVVAMIEAIALATGKRSFAYTSPHLLHFAERMRIAGQPAGETQIVAALEQVERARGDVELSYFEHTTLAALWLAGQSSIDLLVLEVGLGGRLDAVNILDADVAVISSIDIDHAEYLGSSRLQIGMEKAGIARRGRPLILGEPDPPDGFIASLEQLGVSLQRIGHELLVERGENGFRLRSGGRSRDLPVPALAGDWQLNNAACAIAALDALGSGFECSDAAFAEGLRQVQLPGRFQRLQHAPELIVDVAHNPAAAEVLAAALGPASAQSTAVFSALFGKDVTGIASRLDACFTRWLLAPLAGTRGQSAEFLAAELAAVPVAGRLETVESVPAALRRALESSAPDDRIVVFGSFLTVAEAWPELASSPKD